MAMTRWAFSAADSGASAPEARASSTWRLLTRPSCRSPRVRGPLRAEEAPLQPVVGGDLIAEECVDRAPQAGRRRRAPVDDHRRQAVEQQITGQGRVPVAARPIVPLGRPRAAGRRAVPGDRRRGRRTRRRGRCPGRAGDRATRAARRPAAAGPAPRRPESGRPVDLSPQLLDAGALEIVDGGGLGLGQQAERGVERAGVQVGVGGGQGAVRASRRRRRSGRPTAGGTPPRPASPARACALPAVRSSSAATSSSGPVAAAARCHTRRSGSVRRPSPRRAPGARRGGPAVTRPRRRPTAPGDAGTAPGRRSRAAARAAAAAVRSSDAQRPRRPPDRVASPVGSAAASSISRWVGSGSARTRRR